jgi:phosphoribosyl 1,2-cyclic phosphate phosphodiesterase
MGVPILICDCPVCTSSSPYNQRLRPGALLTVKGKKIAIDTSQDFRQQALTHKINHLDGVLYTHAHHDHTAGIDDLRPYHMFYKRSIPCLASAATAKDIMARYSYMFEIQPAETHLEPRVELQILPERDRGDAEFLGIPIKFFTYSQLSMPVTGYRIGNMAFVTDIRDYPSTIFEDLQGLDVLVLSALRFTPSHMHLSIDEAVDFASRTGARHTWLTHLAHELDYDKTNSYLPPNVRLAYDGLEIKLEI